MILQDLFDHRRSHLGQPIVQLSGCFSRMNLGDATPHDITGIDSIGDRDHAQSGGSILGENRMMDQQPRWRGSSDRGRFMAKRPASSSAPSFCPKAMITHASAWIDLSRSMLSGLLMSITLKQGSPDSSAQAPPALA